MLAGLLHGVGKLYILTRASHHPALFASPAAYRDIVRDWHVGIAQALLESWDMPEEIVRAVHDAEDPERDLRGPPVLADVLAVAIEIAAARGIASSEPAELQDAQAGFASRLKVAAAEIESVVNESDAEVAELRRLLGA
jgi:HD-like signal output (HDOD) protein